MYTFQLIFIFQKWFDLVYQVIKDVEGWDTKQIYIL